METSESELLEIISRGEDSRHQFKLDIDNSESLAEELAAFSNSGRGRIFIGVKDDDTAVGLSREDVKRINNLISNASSENVQPAISPKTENVKIGDRIVIIVSVPDGINKPYSDKRGVYWAKAGADKRRASREELQRLFQASGLIHSDETPTTLTLADLDLQFFKQYYEKEYPEKIEDHGAPLARILQNLNLSHASLLNIAGGLLFAKAPQLRLGAFIIKAICFPGKDIHNSEYLDSEDIEGKITDMYQKSMGFILRNLHKVQGTKGINSTGDPEIPKIVLEELIVNALVHRNYFIPAPIKIFIFRNRIEIISPGSLPNNLTIENIKNGISNIRNPVLTSFATKLLPYRGLGTGIRRVLKLCPKIDFHNDTDGNIFRVTIYRASRK